MTLDLVTLVLKCSSNCMTLSSRWRETSNKSLVTGWCGASIRFGFTGSYLNLKFGGQTERKDQWNGGTRMLDISVYPSASHTRPLQTHTFDAEPGSSFIGPVTKEKCIVEITLIDWASVVEIESLVVDAKAVIEPFAEADLLSTILVVGDSISCGYAVGDDDCEPFPRGCLNAFPFQAQQILERHWKCNLDIELIAYPGASLVEPTDEERSKGMSFGMAKKIFHISPWDPQSWEGTCAPIAVALALGTNDENGDVSFDRFMEVLEQFIQKLVEVIRSVREIWLITPFEDFTETQGSVFRQSLLSSVRCVPASVEVCVCDVQDGMTKEKTVDDLHPTLEGQGILGRNFAEFVRTRLEKMDLADKA